MVRTVLDTGLKIQIDSLQQQLRDNNEELKKADHSQSSYLLRLAETKDNYTKGNKVLQQTIHQNELRKSKLKETSMTYPIQYTILYADNLLQLIARTLSIDKQCKADTVQPSKTIASLTD